MVLIGLRTDAKEQELNESQSQLPPLPVLVPVLDPVLEDVVNWRQEFCEVEDVCPKTMLHQYKNKSQALLI